MDASSKQSRRLEPYSFPQALALLRAVGHGRHGSTPFLGRAAWRANYFDP